MRFAFFRSGFALFAAALALAAITGMSFTAAAITASSSPWTAASNSKVRLVSGTLEVDGAQARVAGIQIRLAPGWKTYWKNPGDSGVPPSFDWTGSKNLKKAELLYPAPHRFPDAGGIAIGYADEVIFPVKLMPEREGEPIELRLALSFGLCKDLCIPNEVSLKLTVPAEGGKGDALLLQGALALVPKPSNDGSLPRVAGVEAKLGGDKPHFFVDALFPPGARGTDLFIDGGEVFVPVPEPLGPVADGKQRFVVTFATPKEAAAIKGRELAVTLVSDKGSAETRLVAG